MGAAESLRSAKRAALGALHSIGALRAYHQLRNRHALTVVAFHRVLAEGDERWRTAHPLWTVSQQLFDECLDFFERHYSIVSLEQVAEAVRESAPLPDCPLLITFDDGWADNAEGAAQSLNSRGLPAVVFAVAEALNTGRLWQEPILRASELGQIPAGSPLREREALLEHLGKIAGPDTRGRVQAARNLCIELQEDGSREMLSSKQVGSLRRAGIAVGSHGLTHSALSVLPDPGAELRASRDILERELGERVYSLSFPHGSYNAAVVQEAHAAGYEFLFTSDACLNEAVEGRPLPALIGRLPMLAAEIAEEGGRLAPTLLARWLFLRPIRTLGNAI